ncbi:MAG: DUF3667 domain-containing protein [Bacteroidetes bacterium]|nr:DUF3667 domain-containing protein [Bacteroidota bacterium]
MSDSKQVCASCGNTFTGKYCNQCGEKVVEAKERSIRHFLGQLLNALTFTDTKFIRTLRLLIFRPGFLSKEYVTGRRNLYTSPLSLFFIGNLLYFLILPVDSFTTGLDTQTQGQAYRNIAANMVNRKMERTGKSYEQLKTRFNKKVVDHSKLLLILLVFLFSLPLPVLFFRQKLFYFNHLIYSLGFITFILYVIFLILPMLFFIIQLLMHTVFRINFNPDINSIGFLISLLFLIFIYLFFGLRKFYEQKNAVTFLKSLFLTLWMMFVVLAYRFILFVVTIWLI